MMNGIAGGTLEPDGAPNPAEPGRPLGAHPALQIAETGLPTPVAEPAPNGPPARPADAADQGIALPRGDRTLTEEAGGGQQPPLHPRQGMHQVGRRGQASLT